MVPKLHPSSKVYRAGDTNFSFFPDNVHSYLENWNACMQFKKNTLEVQNSAPLALYMPTWYVVTTVNNNIHILFIIPDDWNYC